MVHADLMIHLLQDTGGYQLPETALQIICDDSFAALEQLHATPYEINYVNKAIERYLPYTRVEKGICGNRYGEYRSKVPSYADFAVQIN
jgi:hypothetical protein